MHKIGAIQQRPCLDRLFKILTKVAADQTYANGSALKDLLGLQLHMLQHPLTGRVDAAAASVVGMAQVLEAWTEGQTAPHRQKVRAVS